MTLRPETIRERLAFVRRNLALLRSAARLPREAFVNDAREQWAAAYGLQVTSQALLDAGAHILSARFAEAPRDYGEIVPLLARHGVLAAGLQAQLERLSGFRNILVRQYADVDFALVHEKLQHLDDLESFALALLVSVGL